MGQSAVRDISVLLNYFEINRGRDAGPLHHRFYTTASSQSFAQIGEEMAGKRDSCGACRIMTNKIYEYKDEQDWYVGSYGIFGGVRTLTDDDLDFSLYWSLPKDFEMRIEVFLFLLLFLRYGPLYRLLSLW